MSDEKVLTKEIAEQFLEDEDSVDLCEFTAIEDEAAESISRSSNREKYLHLSSIKCVTDSAATALSEFTGGIDFSSLVQISDEAILKLASGDVLEGLDETVYVISENFGRDSQLPNTLPETAKDFVLSQILCDDGGVMFLRGPRQGDPLFGQLTVDDASLLRSYSTQPGLHLCLDGWYSVDSHTVLQELCAAPFSTLRIRVDELTVDIAGILATCCSRSLIIAPLSMSEEAATIISACESKLEVNLKNLTFDVQCILREVPSMERWGQMSEPTFTATCSLCGSENTFTLEPGEQDHECLQRNGWRSDPLCGVCNDESDADED
jgi:hypothetical protein